MGNRKLPTYQMLVVIGSILSSKEEKLCGTQLITSHKILSGTLYPILRRLKKEKILISEREKGDPRKLGRPLHVFYHLTRRGKRYGERYNAVAIAANPPLCQFSDF